MIIAILVILIIILMTQVYYLYEQKILDKDLLEILEIQKQFIDTLNSCYDSHTQQLNHLRNSSERLRQQHSKDFAEVLKRLGKRETL